MPRVSGFLAFNASEPKLLITIRFIQLIAGLKFERRSVNQNRNFALILMPFSPLVMMLVGFLSGAQ